MNRQIKLIALQIRFIAPYRPNDQLSILKIIDCYQACNQPKLVIVSKLLPLDLIELIDFLVMSSNLSCLLILIKNIGVQSLVSLVPQGLNAIVICFNRIWSFYELNLLTTCLLILRNFLYLFGEVWPYVLWRDYIVFYQ